MICRNFGQSGLSLTAAMGSSMTEIGSTGKLAVESCNDVLPGLSPPVQPKACLFSGIICFPKWLTRLLACPSQASVSYACILVAAAVAAAARLDWLRDNRMSDASPILQLMIVES